MQVIKKSLVIIMALHTLIIGPANSQEFEKNQPSDAKVNSEICDLKNSIKYIKEDARFWNKLAVASFALSPLTLFTSIPFLGIPACVMAHRSNKLASLIRSAGIIKNPQKKKYSKRQIKRAYRELAKFNNKYISKKEYGPSPWTVEELAGIILSILKEQINEEDGVPHFISVNKRQFSNDLAYSAQKNKEILQSIKTSLSKNLLEMDQAKCPYSDFAVTEDSYSSGLTSLPPEIILKILQFLKPDELRDVSSVSKLLYNISHDFTLQRDIFKAFGMAEEIKSQEDLIKYLSSLIQALTDNPIYKYNKEIKHLLKYKVLPEDKANSPQ